MIADDHPLMLDGLSFVIEQYPAFELIGRAQNGAEALNIIHRDNPDIAILDIDMPLMDGLEVIRRCQQVKTTTSFIIMTFHKEESLYQTAKSLGVLGYLLKDQGREEIIQCVLHVANGQEYISHQLEQILTKQSNDLHGLDELTKTELNVVRLIAQKKTSQEIAEMLFVSKKTVENHRSNICKKLGLDGSKNSLLAWAIEHKSKFI